MNRIFVVPNPNKDKELLITASAVRRLIDNGITVCMDSELSYIGVEGVSFTDGCPPDAHMLLVVGGDGSYIDASVIALRYDIPILGINLGKVGYLAEVDPDRLDLLDRLAGKEYFIDEKLCLEISIIHKDGSCESVERLAVNDVVFSKSDALCIAGIRLEDKAKNSLKYRADALIISTPQGSTAYSLSAGGPIMAHGAHGILVTPACPHSFFNRAVLFSPEERLTISSYGDEELTVSLDGRRVHTLCAGGKCSVSASDRRLKSITFSRNSNFTNMFKKMKILEDF